MTAAAGPTALRGALGRFATGVAIVTCADEHGGFVGLTVNSFNALSLDPPLVLWSLRHASPSLAVFTAAPRIAVNVLAASQVAVSRHFASRVADKFSGGAWTLGPHGAPRLAGCAAVFECERVSHQEAGDHRLFIARVLAFEDAASPPLVFQGGQYHCLGPVV